MMDTSGAKRITELDFDQAKANLVSFLRGQDYWKDYDFTLSGLDAIASQLAYALHYAGFYGNMLGAEEFIDSASLRSSLVSQAKALHYTPRSITAASVFLDVTVKNGTGGNLPLTVSVDKGTVFNAVASVGNVSLSSPFTVVKTAVVTLGATGLPHFFPGVQARQGVYKSFDWAVDFRDTDQRFVLPTDKIDVSLLEVYVQEGNDDTKLTRYSLATNPLGLGPSSDVFFLEETESGKFRIFFGDGILGKKIAHGKIVRAIYFETQGTDGNGLRSFTLQTSTGTNGSTTLLTGSVTVSTLGVSDGGADPESTESIRFNAPRANVARSRALSTADWKSVVLENCADVKSARVWGGEDGKFPYAVPGRIYITLNPVSGFALTAARKDDILQLLNSVYKATSVTPVLVDASYVWLSVSAVLTLNPLAGVSSIDTVKAMARDAILSYSNLNLQQFDMEFEHSKLSTAIDAVDASVSNTELSVKEQSRVVVGVGKTLSYEFDFQNSIVPGSIFSNQFTWQNQVVSIVDSGGDLQLVSKTGVLLYATAGSVDYATGFASLKALRVQKADATGEIRLTAKPTSLNVVSRLNKVLTVDPGLIQIDAIVRS
jgi:hypothetical protein